MIFLFKNIVDEINKDIKFFKIEEKMLAIQKKKTVQKNILEILAQIIKKSSIVNFSFGVFKV